MHRRGTTWSYVVDIGRDPATGHRRQRTKGGFRNKREAERTLATVVRNLDDGTYVARDPQTVEEWVKRWLKTMKPKVRSSTLRDYSNGLGRLVDRLGQLPLQSLRPLDIEEFYASLLKDGHRYGGGLAPKTVRNVHIAVRRSLADAHRLGLVSRNVAALVKPPAPVRHELDTWTADEVRVFLGAVGSDRLAPAYRLLVTTGMRRGEVLGLHWANVDLDGARVVVNRSLTVVNDEMVWASPKTSRSRRTAFVGPRDRCRASRASAAAARGAIERGRGLAGQRPRVLRRGRQGVTPRSLHAPVYRGRPPFGGQGHSSARPSPHVGDARTAGRYPSEGRQ